jgi:cytochrome P450
MTEPARTGSVEATPPPFPMARRCPLSPPPEYAGLRAADPVSKVTLKVSGKEVWVVARYDDVRQVLASPAVSSNWKLPGYPLQVPLPDEVLQNLELPLVAMDPPEHTVRRRTLIPEFTVRRMQALRPRVQQIVDSHLDAMLAAGPPADLVQALAVPVPSLLFCELMGVPAADTGFFRQYAELTTNRETSPEALGAAQQEMELYLHRLVADKGEHPTEDLLSRVVAKNSEDGALAHGDLVAIARMLLFGGFDTVANMISLGTVTLLENPDQLDAIRRDPSLTPKAVDELLRYLSISDSATARVATEDMVVGGVRIRAGEGMILLNGSANRDDAMFTDPDTLDLHRDTKGHAAFGHGVHQCPGASLARVELEIVFNSLFARIPGLRLAEPLERLAFKHDALIYGMYELPVTW